MKFFKFHIRISGIKFTTNNLSKMVFCIGQQISEISSKEGWKTCVSRKNRFKKTDRNHDLFEFPHVFQQSFDDISAICWPILMQNTILERLLVVDYMPEIQMSNFKNFMEKLASEVEICWKSGMCDHIFLNNFEVSSIFLGQVYLFWKLRMPANWKYQ
jgi:hypothetical protein